jgi:plastocyanin
VKITTYRNSALLKHDLSSSNHLQFPRISCQSGTKQRLLQINAFKMRPFLTVVWPLMLATRTSATTHDILVGLHGLSYAPNTTTAAIGDTVTFHFYPGPHNVVQSSFDTPCGWLEGGFYSGYISPDAGESPETFSITINDTSMIWIYCSSYMHCQSGMSMVINPG